MGVKVQFDREPISKIQFDGEPISKNKFGREQISEKNRNPQKTRNSTLFYENDEIPDFSETFQTLPNQSRSTENSFLMLGEARGINLE